MFATCSACWPDMWLSDRTSGLVVRLPYDKVRHSTGGSVVHACNDAGVPSHDRLQYQADVEAHGRPSSALPDDVLRRMPSCQRTQIYKVHTFL